MRLSVAVSGSTTISASPASGSSSNTGSATDGTAFTWGDVGIAYYGITAGNPMQVNINRLVKINAGTNTFTLQAYRSSSSASCLVYYPKISVIPFRTA
jgi:hypothetical protein